MTDEDKRKKEQNERWILDEYMRIVDRLLSDGRYEVVDTLMEKLHGQITVDMTIFFHSSLEPHKFKNRDSYRQMCIEHYRKEVGDERAEKLFVDRIKRK